MKYCIYFLSIVLSVVSCKPKTKKKEAQQVAQKEFLQLADTLELDQSEYEDLLDSVHRLQKKQDLFYRKIHIQKKEIAKLQNENTVLKQEIQKLSKKEANPVLSVAEKAVQKMVFDMHDAWANLAKNKKTDGLMSYFHDQYLVSRISIEADDSASVSRFSHEDFGEYLEETIISVDGLSVEFENVKFLDIEIKDNSYFNVAYKCVMGTYKDDRLQQTNSLMVTITGKNIEGKWGISSYSWVNFVYEKK